jgi:hypothetical protein
MRVAGTQEPSSYTWNANTTISASGGIVAYYNVNPAKRLDVVTSKTVLNSTTIASPSVTTTLNNDQLLIFMTSFKGEATGGWALPAGMTSEWLLEDGAQNIDSAFVDAVVPAAGATGTRTATIPQAATSAVSVLTIQQ